MPAGDGARAAQILTVAQMRAAEDVLIARGSSVGALMALAGHGAAEWVWRIAARGPVTVLCGPGNNGGDGYVIAETLRARGIDVAVAAPHAPHTPAAIAAREAYGGAMLRSGSARHGEVLVDCLYGSGLTRALAPADAALLARLAGTHRLAVAVDLPSGVEADSGAVLNDGLPDYTLTLALGAWKYAHFLMPACARMGAPRLVPIGIEPVDGAAEVISRPRLAPPAPDAHKYTRGLLAVIGGAMPGAARMATRAAQHAGAGYVKLFADDAGDAPADLVVVTRPLAEALPDDRMRALLVGPGLGRDDTARARLGIALTRPVPAVVDADGLMLSRARDLVGRTAPTVVTPHAGELAALERALALPGGGAKPERARLLAKASGAVVIAKGPDTVVAGPDGRLACAPRASSWLSTAGTGDVLAGIVASRLATGAEAFVAACEGVWLHAEAASHCGAAFTAAALADAVPRALAECV